jgi:hypothetical protein
VPGEMPVRADVLHDLFEPNMRRFECFIEDFQARWCS